MTSTTTATYSYRAEIVRDCPVCGEYGMRQYAQVATGATIPEVIIDCGPGREPVVISAYTPARGEVLKNHWMECPACGFEQAS